MENFTNAGPQNPQKTDVTLHDAVANTVRHYLNSPQDLKDPLYDLIIKQAEKPVIEAVLQETRGNQSKAAIMLGLSRGTLRKKIREHGISTHISEKEGQ